MRLALSWTRAEKPWKAIEPGVRPGLKPATVRPAMVVEPLNVAGPDTTRDASVEVVAERDPLMVASPELMRLPTVTGPVAEMGPETLRLPLIVVLPEAKVPAESVPKPASEVPVKFWLGAAG